ncbi:acylneuraminate cytidylyltransferase family protein [Aliarcobacter butzleri]|uniref:acylneuraminate cytidylyltransferase family protein n=1 Tax=Aliarcobacter butzleri TaxID=28197 RepID=UPI001917BE4A|nr:acylneuraminate cytidylyltransferase family protein [Aliarcobacter butzleri]MCG3670041.1 acylneuraminate cytidylyltransferase family protein [Aliarcobacter butzleri]
MKILAIVPSRCGSKGFPGKNIAKIGNQTLLELAVKVGLDCKAVNDVYVSTDCKEYEDIALNAGSKSLGLRPEEFATDSAKSIDVVIDLINRLKEKYDYLVLLQPTAPIREPQDIENMLNLIKDKNVDACVSVTQFEEPHPFKLKKIDSDGYIKSFIDGTTSEVPRQSLPKAYALNGAIYITKIETILNEKTFLPTKTVPYVMNININIDSEEDFIFLEAMVQKKKVKVWGHDI